MLCDLLCDLSFKDAEASYDFSSNDPFPYPRYTDDWFNRYVYLRDFTLRHIVFVSHRAHSNEKSGRQPVTRSQWNASGRPTGDRPAAGKRPAARRRRFHGFLKIEFLRYMGRGTDSKNRRALRLVRINYLIINYLIINYLIINYLIILNSLQLLSVCLIKMSIK